MTKRTETMIYDNENYEMMSKRLTDQNVVMKDRMVETREMIHRYEQSCLKWDSICRESEITMNDVTQRATLLYHQANSDKKDQLNSIHERKQQLHSLDLEISAYNKELESLRD